MTPASLFLRPLKLQPLDLFEQLAVWTKRGAKVRFDQQSGIHNTVIIQVEQLIAQPARGAERRKGRVDRFLFRFQVVGQRRQTGYRQARLVWRVAGFRRQNRDQVISILRCASPPLG